MSYNHPQNNLWHCISKKQRRCSYNCYAEKGSNKDWWRAENALRSDKGLANTIRRVSGISRGTHTWTDDYSGQTGNDGEYPLSTALRMEAPNSLILALLDAHEDTVSVKDNSGLLPLHLAIQRKVYLACNQSFGCQICKCFEKAYYFRLVATSSRSAVETRG